MTFWFKELVKQYNLEEYDVVLYGDGSGTTKDKPCGWHCSIYLPKQEKLIQLGGCLSEGTNNQAELLPFIFALTYLRTNWDLYYQIAILSDSEITVKCGNEEYARNSNQDLWQLFENLQRNSFVRWFWVPRKSNNIAKLCDKLAGQQRKLLVEDAHIYQDDDVELIDCECDNTHKQNNTCCRWCWGA